MLDDQCPSIQFLAEHFNQFLCSLSADYTPLSPLEPGGILSVPEFRINNYKAYQALRRIKGNKSPALTPPPTGFWGTLLLRWHQLFLIFTMHLFLKVLFHRSCRSPSWWMSPSANLRGWGLPTTAFFLFKILFDQNIPRIDFSQAAVVEGLDLVCVLLHHSPILTAITYLGWHSKGQLF